MQAFDPEYFILHRCVVKAERGRKGVIYGRATIIKPLDKFFVSEIHSNL